MRRPIVTDRVPWSVGLSVGLSVTVVSPAKTAEPIEMLFGLKTWVGPGNHVLDGSISPTGKGQEEKEEGTNAPVCMNTPISVSFWPTIQGVKSRTSGPTKLGGTLRRYRRGRFCVMLQAYVHELKNSQYQELQRPFRSIVSAIWAAHAPLAVPQTNPHFHLIHFQSPTH